MLQMKGVKHGDPRIKDLFHGALKPDRFRTSNVRGFCRRTVRKGSAFPSGFPLQFFGRLCLHSEA